MYEVRIMAVCDGPVLITTKFPTLYLFSNSVIHLLGNYFDFIQRRIKYGKDFIVHPIKHIHGREDAYPAVG